MVKTFSSQFNFANAMEIIYHTYEYKCVNMEPDTIWGVSYDNNFEDDYVKATVFMSYSKKRFKNGLPTRTRTSS